MPQEPSFAFAGCHSLYLPLPCVPSSCWLGLFPSAVPPPTISHTAGDFISDGKDVWAWRARAPPLIPHPSSPSDQLSSIVRSATGWWWRSSADDRRRQAVLWLREHGMVWRHLKTTSHGSICILRISTQLLPFLTHVKERLGRVAGGTAARALSCAPSCLRCHYAIFPPLCVWRAGARVIVMWFV